MIIVHTLMNILVCILSQSEQLLSLIAILLNYSYEHLMVDLDIKNHSYISVIESSPGKSDSEYMTCNLFGNDIEIACTSLAIFISSDKQKF